MARVPFAAFKTTRALRRLSKVEQWLSARLEVLAEVVALIAAGEQYSAVYEWLMSDEDDRPDFSLGSFTVLVRGPKWPVFLEAVTPDSA
jgi:hypothetical protein